VSAVIVTVLAFALVLWLHTADTASRFQDVLLLVGYWMPAFVAVVIIDWLIRTRARTTVNPAEEATDRRDAAAALITFVPAYVAAVPVHERIAHREADREGVARRWHRIFREPCGGRAALRELSAAPLAPQHVTPKSTTHY
jgi:nucleobase:cation symporter-1, NCS1 family